MIYLFLKWKFIDSNIDFIKSWFLFLKFGLNIFSVPLLLRTFFWPWHKYQVQYPNGFNPKEILFTFFGNIMSRGIGMILRTFFILIGLFFEFFIFLFGIILFIFWFILPFITIYFLYLGILFLLK
ncbi:MAG: hypothetical protein AAB614_02890 [Patescibacteria group bacterium]